MTMFRNPFDSGLRLRGGCSCGAHASQDAHERALKADAVESGAGDEQARYERVVQSAIMRAMTTADSPMR